MIAASQRRVTRDGPKKQMRISNLKRGGRPSTEVVLCCEPCVWISGTAWIPGARPCWSRRGSSNVHWYHPPGEQSFPVAQQAHQRQSIAASGCWSHVSSSLEGTCTAVLRGLRMHPKEVWLSHALVALSPRRRAPSRPSLIQFVKKPSPTQATARCAQKSRRIYRARFQILPTDSART